MQVDESVEDRMLDKAEERRVIKQFWATPMETGEVWYLLSAKWWQAWQDYCNFKEDPSLSDSDLQPGPIDNTTLLKKEAYDKGKMKLKENLVSDSDYVIVPGTIWSRLQKWYSGGPPLPVKIIEEGILHNKRAEIYRLRLRIIHNAKPMERYTFSFSKMDTVQTLKERVCTKLRIDPTKVRIYNYFANMRHEELKDWEMTLNDAHLVMDQEVMFLEEGVADPLKGKAKGVPNLFGLSSQSGERKSEDMLVGKPSPPGLCGLHNLGNTCFMNSALQCLSNTPILTDYFLSGHHRREINRVNPLGMKGKVAETFGELVKCLWSGKCSSFMPRVFKHTLSNFAPQFSGYAQHDSQELLAFLLDGLHEDLNRVKDKPYIETKESDGRPDVEVAAEAWENHRRRNDSVIVDLFQGQFKSTLVCPDCSKISITFDPFMYLSLPLPGLTTKTIKITVFRDDGSWPMSYGVEVSKLATIKVLKESLSELTGIEPSALLVVEVFQARFHKIFDDKEKVETINPTTDEIYAYEMVLSFDTYPDKVTVPVFISISRVKSVKGSQDSKKSRSLQQVPAGYPVMLSLSRSGLTYRELRKTLWRNLKQYLRKDAFISDPSREADVEDGMQMEDGTELPEEYVRLFSVKLGDISGRKIVEDVVDTDEDEPIVISSKNSFVVVWDAKANEVLESVEPVPHVHESLKEKEDQKGLTLADCLHQFLTQEKLSAEDPWYCPRCKVFVRATKKFDLWQLPDLLVIHLKRFSFSRIWRTKLGSYVDFPLEGLDLSEYTIVPQDSQPIYDLYAVSNHYGDLGGGHYTAFANNKADNKWYEFDDHRVSAVDASSVLSKAAYVLFYKRRTQ